MSKTAKRKNPARSVASAARQQQVNQVRELRRDKQLIQQSRQLLKQIRALHAQLQDELIGLARYVAINQNHRLVPIEPGVPVAE